MTTTSCRTIRVRLSAFRDDVLSIAAAHDVSTHLADCAGCREELREIDTVARLVGGATVAAPDGFDERLRARLAARRRSDDAWNRRGRLARRASLLAATILVALLAGLGPAIVRDATAPPPSINEDENLNLVLFGSPDLDDTRGPSLEDSPRGNGHSE